MRIRNKGEEIYGAPSIDQNSRRRATRISAHAEI
jgi:hypothetical protein